ncbi:MAG: hypothetical protein ACXV8A_05885 [Chthoniobacterales bacterium]
MNSIAIVVSSCDAFFDAWRPFAFFFRKYWADCPFPVYLITNELPVRSDLIRAISVGQDRGWASNLKRALDEIDATRILYLQEDYFLDAPVRAEQFASDVDYAIAHDVDAFYFRARAELEHGFEPLNDRFGIVPRNSDGRTRCQLALWKRDSLLAVLRDDENAWEMESGGSGRTREMRILSYSSRENAPISYLMSAIVRGLWTREALAMCAAANVAIEPRFRGIYSPNEWLQRWRRAQTRRRLRHYLSGRATKIPVSLP